MALHPVAPIIRAYKEERRALLITGRDLSDLELDPVDHKIRPLWEICRRELRAQYGLAYIRYSLSSGLDWDRVRVENASDQRMIENALRANGLADLARDRNETVRVIHGIHQMSRENHEALKWADGSPMRFAFHLMFGEHLAPGGHANGSRTDNHLAVIQLATQTAQSLALRGSGNLVMFSAREGLMDELIVNALHHIHLRQPDEDAKRGFIESVLELLPGVKLETDLSVESIARLTRNTPNSPIEAVLRASRNTERTVTAGDLARERASAVSAISEGTLSILAGAGEIDLRGRNIDLPTRVLRQIGDALRKGDPATPQCLVLVGPPGTGKTVLAEAVARTAGVAAFRIQCPKGGIVGETERKVALQQQLLDEWSPNVAFSDEITEAMPLQRSDFNGDSGATAAWSAALLGALADEQRRGRSLLIGATNCPWRIGAAMRSRLEFVPVFFPLEEDFPGIIAAIAHRLQPSTTIDTAAPAVLEAARILHSKGAGPREIVKAVSRTALGGKDLGPDAILRAAQEECGASDLASIHYADLWALAVTSSRAYLPWSTEPELYPFPVHFQGIVDPRNGAIDRQALSDTLERLRQHANV